MSVPYCQVLELSVKFYINVSNSLAVITISKIHELSLGGGGGFRGCEGIKLLHVHVDWRVNGCPMDAHF